jgi:septal ring factor EnvC (AmiA/AmiB activator)
MSEQQNGALPASAGGVSRPITAVLAEACQGITKEWQRLVESYPGLADLATTPLPPFELRPVLGEPSLNMDGDEDGNEWPDSVGWSLSLGCQLTFSHGGDETGDATAQVSMSDMDLRRGITKRTATRAQVAAFGRLLVEQFGEPAGPDPRDAEIERLREVVEARNEKIEQLASIADKLEEQRDEARAEWQGAEGEVSHLRAELDKYRHDIDFIASERSEARRELTEARCAYETFLRERDDAREEWKRADAEVTRLADELRAIRNRLAVELNRKPSELDGRETTDLAVELADRRGKSVDYWKGLAQQRGRQVDQSARDIREVVAERNRLRAKLDAHLADENSAQAANDRLRDELGNAEAGRDAARAEIRDLRRRLNRIAQETMFESTITTAPRRWVAGDPEPEVGTTVRTADGRTFTRRNNGAWHGQNCSADCPSLGPLWTELLVGAPLVEVASTDG